MAPPEEIRVMLADRRAIASRYEEIRAAAEARVVEWRWTTGLVMEPDLAYWAERRGGKPGRLLRKRPSGLAIRVGIDAGGRPVVVTQGVDDSDPTSAGYELEGGDSVGFELARWSFTFKPPREWVRAAGGWIRVVNVRRVLRDSHDRVVGVVSARSEQEWHAEYYTYGSDGRVITIDEEYSAYEGVSYRLEIAFDDDGAVERIDATGSDGTRSVRYARLHAPIATVLTELERDLGNELADLLRRAPQQPLWAVALAYDQEDPLPPTVIVCTQQERDSWKPGGDRDWELLNPAEWYDVAAPSLRLSDDLDERMRIASTEVRKQPHKGAALLRRVARDLNTGESLVFARAVRGDSERRDLRDSLPDERMDLLREIGAI